MMRRREHSSTGLESFFGFRVQVLILFCNKVTLPFWGLEITEPPSENYPCAGFVALVTCPFFAFTAFPKGSKGPNNQVLRFRIVVT